MVLKTIAYPMALDGNGSLKLAERADCISQQILSILETRPGERIMLPTYGFRDHILNSLSPSIVISDIENAIQRWVPQAKNVKVTFDSNPAKFEDGRLDITINFQYQNRDLSITAEVSDA